MNCLGRSVIDRDAGGQAEERREAADYAESTERDTAGSFGSLADQLRAAMKPRGDADGGDDV